MTAHPVTLECVETENGLEVSSVSAACPPASGPKTLRFRAVGLWSPGCPRGLLGPGATPGWGRTSRRAGHVRLGQLKGTVSRRNPNSDIFVRENHGVVTAFSGRPTMPTDHWPAAH